MSRWPQSVTREVRHMMQLRSTENLGFNDPFMAAAGASDNEKLRGLFYLWYFEATDMSFFTPDGYPIWTHTWEHSFLSQHTIAMDYRAIFDIANERLLAPAELSRAMTGPDPDMGPSIARAPRYPTTEKRRRALQASGLRPGYDFNGGGAYRERSDEEALWQSGYDQGYCHAWDLRDPEVDLDASGGNAYEAGYRHGYLTGRHGVEAPWDPSEFASLRR